MNRNNTTSRRPILAAILLSAAMVSQAAFADCFQSDLQGVWFVNGFSQDPNSGENENLYCKIKFGSGGSVLAGSSSCTARFKGSTESVNILGGNLSLNSTCNATGFVRFSDGGRLTVDSARMDINKTVFHLVGVGEGPDRWHVVLNGTKREFLF